MTKKQYITELKTYSTFYFSAYGRGTHVLVVLFVCVYFVFPFFPYFFVLFLVFFLISKIVYYKCDCSCNIIISRNSILKYF